MPGDCREGIRYAAAPPRSAVRTSVERSQAGHRYRPGRGRRSDLLAPHGRAVPHQRRCLCHGACASDAHLMNTAALKRELALLRSSLAALTPAQSITLDDPVAWAERIAGLTLDPWQRDVLLSLSPRLLLNATRQSGKSTTAALKAARTVLQGGLAVVRRRYVSPASCSVSFPATLSPLRPASGARRSLRSNSPRAGWRCLCLAIVRPCCAAFRCATTVRRC